MLLSDQSFRMITLAAVVMAAEYACVFIAVLIDLRSGTLKAKRCGLKRTSRGYRRTVEKASRYFITLIALSVLDAMCVVAALGLRSVTGWAVPPFPFFTTIGAVGLVLIEIHSVVENSQRRSDVTDAARALSSLLEDDAVKKLIELFDKYK